MGERWAWFFVLLILARVVRQKLFTRMKWGNTSCLGLGSGIVLERLQLSLILTVLPSFGLLRRKWRGLRLQVPRRRWRGCRSVGSPLNVASAARRTAMESRHVIWTLSDFSDSDFRVLFWLMSFRWSSAATGFAVLHAQAAQASQTWELRRELTGWQHTAANQFDQLWRAWRVTITK